MNGELACLCDEGETLDTDDVTYVEEFLEDGVVQGLVLARTDFVPVYVYLYSARLILQFSE